MLLNNKPLNNSGIATYYDVLLHFPRCYKSLINTRERNIVDGEKIVFYGKIKKLNISCLSNRKIIKFIFITDKKNIFNVISFNIYLKRMLLFNSKYVITGIFNKMRNNIVLSDIFFFDENKIKKPLPIYSLPSGISQKHFDKILQEAFLREEISNIIPDFFKKKYGLLNKNQILKKIHYPDSFDDVKIAKKYMKYEECLIFSIKNELAKYSLSKNSTKNKKKIILYSEINNFIKKINVNLTNSQQKAIKSILSDMNKNKIMFRLLQGDVGSGKTLIATVALYGNFLRGEQGCLMAPTDSLVRQHYETLKNFFKNMDVNIGVFVSQMTVKEKNEVKKNIANKKIDILIGTQSLFSNVVNYNSLGLIVIDEQHRFGVNQRNKLINKGNCADILLISATPIPRTLALTIYGNIDTTILDEFPFKKRQVVTKVVRKNDRIIDVLINESLKNNKQVYIIAPAIESNLKINTKILFKEYSLKYPNKVILLHGKMSQEKKKETFNDFLKNKFPIIVSTTIVEVGLNIKKANLIIIYDAINFGLASLHQLRGRVGRDGEKANCLLVCDKLENIEKLKILEKTDDGFAIANEDLKMRGPGELCGSKQSGLPDFKFVNVIEDVDIFKCAKKDAQFIIDHADRFKIILNKFGNLK